MFIVIEIRWFWFFIMNGKSISSLCKSSRVMIGFSSLKQLFLVQKKVEGDYLVFFLLVDDNATR